MLARLAASDATIPELARALDRDIAVTRRAAGHLASRGLLRRRSAARGPVFEATPSGAAAVRRLVRPLEHPPERSEPSAGGGVGMRA